jgi:hypothetical protein
MQGSIGFHVTALHRGVCPGNLSIAAPVFLCQIRILPSGDRGVSVLSTFERKGMLWEQLTYLRCH